MRARFEHVDHGPNQTEWFRCPWCVSIIVARTVLVGGPYRGGSSDQVAQVTITATCEGCGRFTTYLLPTAHRLGRPVTEEEWQAALEMMVSPDLEDPTVARIREDEESGGDK
jgi:hypothetical protein